MLSEQREGFSYFCRRSRNGQTSLTFSSSRKQNSVKVFRPQRWTLVTGRSEGQQEWPYFNFLRFCYVKRVIFFGVCES